MVAEAETALCVEGELDVSEEEARRDLCAALGIRPRPEIDRSQWFSAAQIIQLTGKSESTVYRLIRAAEAAGTIEAIRVCERGHNVTLYRAKTSGAWPTGHGTGSVASGVTR